MDLNFKEKKNSIYFELLRKYALKQEFCIENGYF